jgi:hypothetical protein
VIGRLPIAEIIFLDKVGRGFIREGDLNAWLDYLKSRGWKSMEDSAAEKILRGRLCPIIVEKSLESPYGINADSFDYNQFGIDLGDRRQAETATLRRLVHPEIDQEVAHVR